VAIKKKRKFSKENWLRLMEAVKATAAEPPAPPKSQEEPKVEVHVHNNFPDFGNIKNSADHDLDRMTGNNMKKWVMP
jgi:hypothetical protein